MLCPLFLFLIPLLYILHIPDFRPLLLYHSVLIVPFFFLRILLLFYFFFLCFLRCTSYHILFFSPSILYLLFFFDNIYAYTVSKLPAFLHPFYISVTFSLVIYILIYIL